MADFHRVQRPNLVQAMAHPLSGVTGEYDLLLDLIRDARFILIGVGSHGTHEFYQARAEITKHLIEHHSFSAVAVEADWLAAYRVNQYVQGGSTDSSAEGVLADFTCFPAWMWRNTDVLAFVEWLRRYNARQPAPMAKVGFYGLDLYSLYASLEAVLTVLDQTNPETAWRVRERYACFEDPHQGNQKYGSVPSKGRESCEDTVIQHLLDWHRQSSRHVQPDGLLADNASFCAEHCARLARNAEAYYRTMFYGYVPAWNQRDHHLAETLNALAAHLERRSGRAKVVVWAHNLHVGDARATEFGRQGGVTIGQLAREEYELEVVLVGMTTYTGTVTAASSWGGPAERKWVPPALPGSYEALLHRIDLPDVLLLLNEEARGAVCGEGRERAIGTIYCPETKWLSQYFRAQLPRQFDVLLHLDETHAVEPLERNAVWLVA